MTSHHLLRLANALRRTPPHTLMIEKSLRCYRRLQFRGDHMFRVLTCLEVQHDYRLVFLAGCVCLLTSLAAVNLLQRARVVEGRSRLIWLLTAGIVTGWGVWST